MKNRSRNKIIKTLFKQRTLIAISVLTLTGMASVSAYQLNVATSPVVSDAEMAKSESVAQSNEPGTPSEDQTVKSESNGTVSSPAQPAPDKGAEIRSETDRTAQPKKTDSASSPQPATPVNSQPTAPAPAPAASEYASEADCPGQADVNATNTVLVCLVSQARKFHGLGVVNGQNNLMTAAGHKAIDIQNCGFSHTACDRPFGYWITADGYPAGCYAENIAKGQSTPIAVFTAWMNSAGHRANMMKQSYKDIGVAYLSNGGNPIWVMLLGGC